MKSEIKEPVPNEAVVNWPAYASMICRIVGGDFDNYAAFILDDRRRVEMLRIIHDTLEPLNVNTSEEDLVLLTTLAFRLAQWASHGLNTFDVTTSLAASLLLTTPSNDLGFPNLPFPAFLIRVPKGLIPLIVTHQGSTTTLWVDKITVNQVLSGPAPHRVVTQVVCGSALGEVPDLCLNMFHDEFVSPAHMCKEIVDSFEGSSNIIDNNDVISQQLSFMLVCNLCAWLESIGGLNGRKPDNSRTHTKNNNDDKDGRITQWIVGREVKLAPELLRSAKDHILGLDPHRRSASWSLSRQHTVRGHYRWQACGPRMTDRKRIWIKPHWHGPKGGDVAAHIYKMQQQDEKRR